MKKILFWIFVAGMTIYCPSLTVAEETANPNDLFDTAMAQFNAKNYEQASELFREILSEHSESEFADDALFQIGMIYSEQNDYQQAINVFTKLIMDFPDSELVAKANEKLKQLKMGSLSIATNPDGADITVDGKNAGTTPLNVKEIIVGEHKILIEKDGYGKVEKTVTIEEQKTTTVDITLTRAVGTLMVVSNPADAEVYLNAEPAGKTPATLKDISEGVYVVVIKKADYEAWTDTVSIKTGDAKMINAELTVIKSVINVTTEPDSCNVFLNEETSSYSPAVFTGLSPGEYKIKIIKEKYEESITAVAVKPGKKYDINVVMEPKKGNLTLNSAPPSAKAYLNGNLIGVTPIVVTKLIPDTYVVRIEKDGYETFGQAVHVVFNETLTINAELKEIKKFGNIAVGSNVGGKVLLNGEFKGTSPYSALNIVVGTYEVSIENDTCYVWRKSVSVAEGETTEVFANLIEFDNIGFSEIKVLAFQEGVDLMTAKNNQEIIDAFSKSKKRPSILCGIALMQSNKLKPAVREFIAVEEKSNSAKTRADANYFINEIIGYRMTPSELQDYITDTGSAKHVDSAMYSLALYYEFYFNDYKKAVETYGFILSKYPDTEFAKTANERKKKLEELLKK